MKSLSGSFARIVVEAVLNDDIIDASTTLFIRLMQSIYFTDNYDKMS